MTEGSSRSRYAGSLALSFCLLLAVSCATVPPARPPAPLPGARLKEVRTLLDEGSFLQGLQQISALRREKTPDIRPSDLDTLESRAIDALSSALDKAVAEKRWDDVLRYVRSANALGRTDIAADWKERNTLEQKAAALDAAGEPLSALLARLRSLSPGDPSEMSPGATEADLREALDLALRAGNRAAIRSVAERMKRSGYPVPEEAAAAAVAAPSFPEMLKGTVTIMVNRGIKIEKGVGYPDRVIGSGFFIDKRGYLLTNYHVIKSEVDPKYEGYSRLFVKLSDSAAGERIPAKVVGYDTVFDLALIKAETTPDFAFAGLGTEAVAPGERIYAIGSPAGLEKTITSGIVSAIGRRFLQMGDALQVDVPLNPGNSGGPLLNENGDLIGVVFAGLAQFQGLNFAIPYTWIEEALPLLYKGGEAVHPWLGMALTETEQGLEVVYVVPDEPAAKAGIEPGDQLESLNGTRYRTLRDIQEAILRHSPPTLVRVSFRRGEKSIEGLLCLSQRPQSPVEIGLKRDARDNILYPLFGMKLERVGNFLFKNDYIVKRVTRGSVADEADLSENDPLIIQDWKVDTEKGYAVLQIVIKKRKAGFIESVVQIAAYLETDNFV